MLFEEFKDGRHGGHLGYRKGMILAILNLCVTVTPPIKFWLNPTNGLGGDVIWRISRRPPWWPSWITKQNNFSNSESLCPSSFGSIGLTVWEEMSLEEFQDGCHGCHLGYWNETILAILNLCVTVTPPIKFQLNQTYGLGEDVIWRISRWPPWQPPWILEQNDFSNSESSCFHNASH